MDIQRIASVLAIVALRLLQMRDLAEDPAEGDSPEALHNLVPPMYRLLAAGIAGDESPIAYATDILANHRQARRLSGAQA